MASPPASLGLAIYYDAGILFATDQWWDDETVLAPGHFQLAHLKLCTYTGGFQHVSEDSACVNGHCTCQAQVNLTSLEAKLIRHDEPFIEDLGLCLSSHTHPQYKMGAGKWKERERERGVGKWLPLALNHPKSRQKHDSLVLLLLNHFIDIKTCCKYIWRWNTS